MSEASVSLASLSIVATCVGGIIWALKYFASTLVQDLKEHTKAAMELSQSNLDLQESVKSMDTYLRDRNGRDAEKHVEQIAAQRAVTKTLEGLPDKIQAIADEAKHEIINQDIKTQHVQHQTVEHETHKEG